MNSNTDMILTHIPLRHQENTLIDDSGSAQLCDFGLAKVLDAEPTGLTTTKTTSWSLRYAAPELIRNDQSSHTLESDVWAWACLLFVVRSQLPTLGSVAHLTLAYDGHLPLRGS